MTDRVALAAALERFTANWHSGDFKIVAEAARERLAQLPEKCEHEGYTKPHAIGRDICSGMVYPAELVERIAGIIHHRASPYDAAVAVLDALNGTP